MNNFPTNFEQHRKQHHTFHTMFVIVHAAQS